MATVDTLLVRIEADMSQLKSQLNKSQGAVQQSVGKQQKSFSALGATIKGVVGLVVVQQAIKFGSMMVKMASDVEEMQAKSSVVFGDFVGQVRGDLTEFGNAVGRSSFELEGMASSIQDTFVPMGFARGEAAKLSIDLTKLAVDVASFNNASDTDTMRAFQSALVGNHETVRRFGVVITEATLNQELLRMGITKNSKEVSNAEKVQARMNLILAGTTDAQGDAIRTADSFANRSKALGAEFDELIVSLGSQMLPALSDFVAGMTSAVKVTRDFLVAIGKIPRDLGTQAKRLEEIVRLEKVLADFRNQSFLTRYSALTKGQIKLLESQIGHLKFFAEGQAMANDAIFLNTKTIEQNTKAKLDAEKALQSSMPVSRAKGTQDVKGKDTKEFTEFKKMQAVINDVAMANQLLQMRIDGRTEAEIRSAEFAMKNIDATAFNIEQMTENITKQEQLTDAIKKTDEANAKTNATNNSVLSQLESISDANELLQMKINGSTDAEIKKHEAMMANIGASPEYLAVLMSQIEAEEKLNKELERKNELDNLQVQKKQDFIALEESLRTPTEEVLILQQQLNQAYEEGFLTQEQYALGTENIKIKMLEATEAGRTALDAINKVADGFSEGFTNALMNGELSLQSLGNTVKEVMAGLIRDFIKAQIRAMILKMILASMGMGGPSAGSFTGSGNLSGVGGYASGGTVQAKTPIMVGERGAEMFIPNTGGVVRNAQDTRSASGGKPVIVNQNINISTGVAQTVRAEVMNMMPQISQSTITAIVDAKQRGGAFATIMS